MALRSSLQFGIVFPQKRRRRFRRSSKGSRFRNGDEGRIGLLPRKGSSSTTRSEGAPTPRCGIRWIGESLCSRLSLSLSRVRAAVPRAEGGLGKPCLPEAEGSYLDAP